MRVKNLGFIGIILFIILLLRLQPANVVQIILKANVYYFVMAFLIFPAIFLISGLRWMIIASALGLNCSFRKAVLASFIG